MLLWSSGGYEHSGLESSQAMVGNAGLEMS
jgi:hypothetical protein